jgi:hypothetical protein
MRSDTIKAELNLNQKPSMFAPATSANITMANFSDLVVYDPVANAKGQKNSCIVRDGQNAYWVLPSAVSPIWQPSAFKSASGESNGKLSLCVNAEADVLAEAASLDAWAITYATAHSERLFGKLLTQAQVADRYNGTLKVMPDKPSYLKFKLGVDRNAPNYWDGEKQRREAPDDFTRSQLVCRLRLLSFWFMSNSFGLTIQLADAQVTSEQAGGSICPF